MTLESSKQIDSIIKKINIINKDLEEMLEKSIYPSQNKSKKYNKKFRKFDTKTKNGLILNFIFKNDIAPMFLKNSKINNSKISYQSKTKIKELLDFLKDFKDHLKEESNARKVVEHAYLSNIIGIGVILFVVVSAWIQVMIYRDTFGRFVFTSLYFGLLFVIMVVSLQFMAMTKFLEIPIILWKRVKEELKNVKGIVFIILIIVIIFIIIFIMSIIWIYLTKSGFNNPLLTLSQTFQFHSAL